ncbi:MAG TPA: TIGR03118 family protein [Bryobacteraceae bacterium]
MLFLKPNRCALTLAAVLAFGAAQPRLLSAAQFIQRNLTSDIPGMALHTDPNLKNPWGISFFPTSPFWVSNQVSGNSTLYGANGAARSLVVTTPPGGPTGQVSNSTSDFPAGNGSPSLFVFATLAGTIDAWNGQSGTTATVAASTPGAAYTGLAMANNGSGNFLYAANAAGARIDVFDGNFHPATLAGSFTDPNLPAGYTPYNIQTVGGNLYVEYSQGFNVGAGLGIVNEFDANGNLIKRLITGGALNAPWGITLAPAGFSDFGGALLVGNLGDGRINAFNPNDGTLLGTLSDAAGQPLVNDGLWALAFRNAPGFDPNALYFTAGINGQTDGLFGTISPSPEPGTFLVSALAAAALLLARRRLVSRR